MSINVVVSSTAAGVSVSGGTAVDITVGGGIGPAGFITAPGTATNAFGTFQLVSGDGVTITTNAGQFVIASYDTAAVAGLAPVQSVAGRTGAVTLQAADITAGTLDIARIPTISYTALSNVPATFAPEAHTHGTADVVGLTAAASAAAPVQSVNGLTGAVTIARADLTAAAEVHTHSTADIVSFTASAAAAAPVQSVAGRTGTISLAAADVSGLAAVATSGSYTSLSEIPVEFTPATHTHDYAASVHTHSTADISGYSSLPSQAGADGPLVTDGAAATWATRYSVVDPVLVEGAGMTLSRDTAAGEITIAFAGGTSGIVVSSATPQPLGTAAAGSSGDAARADHVHAMPSAADVGAVPSVNGISSAITIAAGDNVTVSTASSTITIAAGGGGGSGGGVAMSYLFS
jgi:hypothetical protein